MELHHQPRQLVFTIIGWMKLQTGYANVYLLSILKHSRKQEVNTPAKTLRNSKIQSLSMLPSCYLQDVNKHSQEKDLMLKNKIGNLCLSHLILRGKSYCI
jgi:hypothetical protein